jgi:hypothetical protein
VRASKVYGADGYARVNLLIRHVRGTYRYVPPETVTIGVTVVRSAEAGLQPPSHEKLSADAVEVLDLAGLSDKYRDGATIVELANGRFLLDHASLDPSACAPEELVYRFHPDTGEAFHIDGERVAVHSSEFFLTAYAAPTFFDLEEALNAYAERIARYGQRNGLRGLWRDPNRLMFLPKPEEGMRRSLEDFLDATLRSTTDVELRPEQIVDETKPADIKVTFFDASRLAYLEIKWMGDSAPEPPATKPFGNPRDQAVKDGAQQLAEYLDFDRARSPGKVVTGYLVVFDGRRGALTTETTEIDRENGMKYEHREVEIDSEILAREDFALPRRMFMEPVCQA